MKTVEELNALKEEVEALNAKLSELSEEEIAQVSGGWTYWLPGIKVGDGKWPYSKDQSSDQKIVGKGLDPHWVG